MAKQYLFFKHTAEKMPFVAAEDLFRLELSAYFSNLQKINNIFELYRYPEIKQIIEKDTDLQGYITHALPDEGFHGFLAICEISPPTELLVKRLTLCDEFILFQRSHEPNDTYIRYLSSKGIITKMQVYNWHVFVIRTMRSFFAPIAEFTGKNPGFEKSDKFFKTFATHYAYRDEPHKDPLHIKPNIMDPLNTNLSRLSAALLNILLTPQHSLIEIPATSSHLARHAQLIGILTTGYPRSARHSLDQSTRLHASRLSLPVVTEAVLRVVKLLDQLLDSPRYQQSHLFYTDIDREFKHHESNIMIQNPELRSFKRHLRLYRYIIATRFLLEREYITHDKQINAFLMFNLLQTINLSLQTAPGAPFNHIFEKNALRLISEIYLSQKMQELFVLKPANAQLVESGFSLPPNETGKNHGFFLRLPEHQEKEPMAGKKHLALALQLFSPDRESIRHPEFSETLKKRYAKSLETQKYISEKLEFYHSFLPRDSYITLINQCLSVYYSLDQILKNIQSQDRLCILSEKNCHYIDETPHEFSFARLIKDYLLSQSRFKFSLDHQFQIHTGNPCVMHEVTFLTCQ